MKIEEKRFRIIKKEDDGITLELPGNEIYKAPWEEFNSVMEIADDSYAKFKSNTDEIFDSIHPLITEAVYEILRVYAIYNGNRKLEPDESRIRLRKFIGYVNRSIELSGYSRKDIMDLIKDGIDLIKSPIIDPYIDPDKYNRFKELVNTEVGSNIPEPLQFTLDIIDLFR